MISQETIRRILEISIQAPSGSNSQPWRFEIQGNQLNIFAMPEMDNPLLNFRCRGTWVAHGALLENIITTSCAFGYAPTYSLFPDSKNKNLIARVSLEESTPKDNFLYPFISLRTTNRKPYNLHPLTIQQKTELFDIAKEIEGVELKLVEEKDKINQIAKAESKGEIVLFENHLLHKLFFEKVVWSKKEEQKKGRVFYVKTKELKLFQRIALWFFRYWPIMNFVNKFGMTKIIAKVSSKKYATSSAMGVIIVENKDEDFITAGRLMQRLWLVVTKLGLSFQLLTLVPFLWQRIEAGDTKEFSKEHIKLIENAYRQIASLFNLTDNTKIIALLFRIGYGGKPSAQSIKKPPEIIFHG